MNFTQLAGHLGADPEERRTSGGKKVVSLRVAVHGWSDGKEETIWWNVSCWGDEFDNILKFLKKGSAIIVLGIMRRKPRIWTDREGKPQASLELDARMLWFNPFGKTERPNAEGGVVAEGSFGANSGYKAAGGMMGMPAPGAPLAGAGAFGMSEFGAPSFSPQPGGYHYEAPSGSAGPDEEMPF